MHLTSGYNCWLSLLAITAGSHCWLSLLALTAGSHCSQIEDAIAAAERTFVIFPERKPPELDGAIRRASARKASLEKDFAGKCDGADRAKGIGCS